MYEILEKLLEEHNMSAYRLSKETGVTTATLTSWKQGKYVPKQDKLQKIADYFGVTVTYLMTGKNEPEKREPQLKPKDEREIENIISNTEQLLKQPGLMFDGKPASQEAIDSVLSAMHVGMELAKKKNKELYTPNKYKKEK